MGRIVGIDLGTTNSLVAYVDAQTGQPKCITGPYGSTLCPSVVSLDPDGSVIVDGLASLRALNRKLGTTFALDGPKTLSGLIVEKLGDIPDAGVNFSLDGQRVEVLQVQDRAVKVVKLLPPVGRAAPAALQSSGEQASSIS